MKRFIPLVFIALASAPGTASAQQAKPVGFPDAPGRDTTLKLCFQCHSDAMFRDHRQDRRGWEGVLYRMVGRGALWTQDEINEMAGYLGAVYSGPAGKNTK
jgi:competence protein ComEA